MQRNNVSATFRSWNNYRWARFSSVLLKISRIGFFVASNNDNHSSANDDHHAKDNSSPGISTANDDDGQDYNHDEAYHYYYEGMDGFGLVSFLLATQNWRKAISLFVLLFNKKNGSKLYSNDFIC